MEIDNLRYLKMDMDRTDNCYAFTSYLSIFFVKCYVRFEIIYIFC